MTNQEIIDKFNSTKNGKLVASLVIDLFGMASFVIPALGEMADIIIAPLSAVAIYMVHRTKIGSAIGFVEEIVPFTDIVPTATIIWFRKYQVNKHETLAQFIADMKNDKESTNKILNSSGMVDTIEFDQHGNQIEGE